jgi:hypothetical protein
MKEPESLLLKNMYRIFISHSWNYNNQYNKILEFLDNGGVEYYNHSVPKDDPVHTNGSDKELEAAIEAKVVIGTGIWVRHGSEFSVSPRCCKKEAQKVEMF